MPAPARPASGASLYALGAIALWASLATLGTALAHVPPFLLTGLGPLGAAFYLWDRALKRGDARQIGILSYLTPLGSTALLLGATGRPLTWTIALAAVLIISAAVMGTRALKTESGTGQNAEGVQK